MDVRGFIGTLQSLNGIYELDTKETNHGRPVYRKNTKEQTCAIYWWDNRDGEAMKGWWIAPVVGGEHVWTQCTVDQDEPPRTGWKVPWHGNVDNRVVMTPLPRGGSKRSNTQVSDRSVKPRHGVIESRATTGASYSGGLGRRPDPPGEDVRGVSHVNVAEGEVRKAQAQTDFELQDRAIRLAKDVIAKVRRQPLGDKQKTRLEGLDRELSVTESKMKREMKDRETKMLEELKDDTMKKRKAELEKHVEAGSDAVGILNSDVADHLSPEDVFESTDATDKALVVICKDLEAMRKSLVEKDEEAKRIHKLGGSLGHPFKELTEFRQFVAQQDKKYNDIKALCDKYKKKAQNDIAARKKEEEELRRKEELERHTAEAKIWLDETKSFLEELEAAFNTVSNSDPAKIGTVTEARTQLNLLHDVADVFNVSYPAKMKVLDERLKQVIASGPLYEAQKKMKEMKIEIEKNDFKKVKGNESKLTNFIREQVMLEMSLLLRQKNEDLTALFHEIAGEEKKVTLEAFSEYCKSAGASEVMLQNVPLVFNGVAVGGHVLEDEFPFLTQVYYKLCRPSWLTKTIEIERNGSVRLDVDSIVEVLSMPQREAATGQMPSPPLRIQVRTQEEPKREGWLTVTGNKGSQFTRLHTFEYEVVKDTVMTDQLQMKGFKVLKRLKVADRFRALGYGIVESTSKAVRIKGRLLHNPDLRGWATLVGNQGSAYLQPVDQDATRN